MKLAFILNALLPAMLDAWSLKVKQIAWSHFHLVPLYLIYYLNASSCWLVDVHNSILAGIVVPLSHFSTGLWYKSTQWQDFLSLHRTCFMHFQYDSIPAMASYYINNLMPEYSANWSYPYHSNIQILKQLSYQQTTCLQFPDFLFHLMDGLFCSFLYLLLILLPMQQQSSSFFTNSKAV